MGRGRKELVPSDWSTNDRAFDSFSFCIRTYDGRKWKKGELRGV